MAKLKFGTFSWPVDPGRFQVSYQKKPVYVKDAAGVQQFSHMGTAICTISGTGIFYGKNAWANYRALEQLLGTSSPAELVHPQWGSCSVYLTELQLTQEPKSDYLAYSFTFCKADSF